MCLRLFGFVCQQGGTHWLPATNASLGYRTRAVEGDTLGKQICRQLAIHRYFIVLKKDFMATALKYMVDENGDKTSVLVPLKTWEKINEDYSKLQNKLKVLIGIKEGLAEVRDAKKSGKKLQTLKDFLRESNS